MALQTVEALSGKLNYSIYTDYVKSPVVRQAHHNRTLQN